MLDILSGVGTVVALVMSGIALWYSRNADQRAAAAEEREVEQHRRQEVFFAAEFVKEHRGVYEFRLVNTGSKTPNFPKVAPESVERFAVLNTIWGSAAPHVPLEFRYEKPLRGQMETLTLRWSGPGAGEQIIPIPPHREAT